jgi:hypothetical protein
MPLLQHETRSAADKCELADGAHKVGDAAEKGREVVALQGTALKPDAAVSEVLIARDHASDARDGIGQGCSRAGSTAERPLHRGGYMASPCRWAAKTRQTFTLAKIRISFARS